MLLNEKILTPSQQKIGLTRYLWFMRINAISFACLADNILILFAIKNGSDDFLLGLLTSFFYLTMPFMFLGKQMVGKLGAARTYATSWMSRNLSAAMMIAVPIVIHKINLTAGLILLAISSFGFFTFRSIGITANTPILGEVTNKNNRGQYLSQIWLYFNLFYFFTMAVLVFILRQSDSLSTFQAIIAFGCMTGLISASLIYRVPESKNTYVSGKKPLKNSIAFVWKNMTTRRLLFAWTAAVVIIMLTNPFSMVALKNGYKISDDNALFFALFQIVGATIASFVNRLVLDRVGPRPMLFLYAFGQLIISFFWSIAPTNLILLHPLIIFLLTGACRAGTMTTISHYFLAVVPGEERVGANMFMYVISGSIAGLAGTFVGGGLLKILPDFDLVGLSIYRVYFLIILIAIIPLLFVIRHLQRIADWTIKDVLGIFVSFRDIRALFTLHRLDKDLTLTQEYKGVESLRQLPSELSEKKLLAYLDSPRFNVRGKALGALGQINISHKSITAIINELERGEYTTAYIAAEILGENRIKQAIPALRHSLHSEDIYLQGKSIVALAQLGDEFSYPQIETIFISTLNPRLIIHGARAIVEMNDLKRLHLILEKSIDNGLPAQVQQELLYSICELCNCEHQFYQFLKAYKDNRENGLSTLIEIIDTFAESSKFNPSTITEQIQILKTQSKCDCKMISDCIMKFIEQCQRPVSLIVKKFLNQIDISQLYPQLVYCLLLIVSKDNTTA